MSLVWIDGFDSQDLTRWTLTGTPTPVAGRLGGYGVQLNTAAEAITRSIPDIHVGQFSVEALQNLSSTSQTGQFTVEALTPLSILASQVGGFSVEVLEEMCYPTLLLELWN